ncbi:MAG: DUF4912 domain-containing protein [Polyangiaceae bacterium]
MERTELEALDRDALIARAKGAGVAKAQVLTRPELIDELLLRQAKKEDPNASRARGFFGRARDLLARVIEKGLHLPEAAELIRTKPVTVPKRATPTAVPTVTLAEIYATQGHKERAIETLRRVLEIEPEHAAARTLLAQLESSAYAVPNPPLPPEEDEEPAVAASGSDAESTNAAEPAAVEPWGMLDDALLPPKYDVDECIVIPVDPRTMFAYWEMRDDTRAHLEKSRPGGHLSLRVLIIEPTWDGPRTRQRDHEIGATLGDWFIRDLPTGCVVRAAVGWRTGEVFMPVAHSPALEVAPSAPSPVIAESLVRWTPKGSIPIDIEDVESEGIVRALGVVHAYRVARVKAKRAAARGGSSELMIQVKN